MVSDFLLDHEGRDLFACARWGQDFAPIFPWPLPISRAHQRSFSPTSAYLRLLFSDPRTCRFSLITAYVPGTMPRHDLRFLQPKSFD